ncbi:Short-chain dehydrogenase reductase tropE [Hyphodiscus hymeniophilus]|uniref:Short-chain dehydrogenase reductase tropE n=1 Tax=Hyphodiscus hymeniophilus TaxID=353542 RepID=A0A9P6VPW1_9HELO|nr:Short-chain dehydrogenase reductase tropE [Hyphodiscus hymeniophilus]
MCAQKTVLITGGNGGIGYATAAALAASPAYHVIIGSRSLEKGKTALAKLSSKGSVSLVQLDVTDATSIAAAVATVEKDRGRLDTLINNAGVGPTSPSLSVELLRNTFETNVFGVAAVTDAFLPLLRKSLDPRLIHVTSPLGSSTLRASGAPLPPFHTYEISKAALNMLALIHRDLFKGEIKVITLDPGFNATNLGGDPEAMRRGGGGDPAKAGEFIKSVVEGKRDADSNKMINEGGSIPW